MHTVEQDYKADKKRLKDEKNMLKKQQKQQNDTVDHLGEP